MQFPYWVHLLWLQNLQEHDFVMIHDAGQSNFLFEGQPQLEYPVPSKKGLHVASPWQMDMFIAIINPTTSP